MSDLSDLAKCGHDARVLLTAFKTGLESLSDPHYQFKPHAEHMRAALFLLAHAQEIVAHELKRRERKKSHDGYLSAEEAMEE